MPEIRTIYFKGDGKAYTLAAIDANRALREHSDEWSHEPWPKTKQSKADAKSDAKTDTKSEGGDDSKDGKDDESGTDLLNATIDDKAKTEQTKV